MKEYIEERAVHLANYIIENGATVRVTAKHFNVSKSTVHKDVGARLCQIDRELYLKVKCVLEKNKSERHIRGGIATQAKFKSKKIQQAI